MNELREVKMTMFNNSSNMLFHPFLSAQPHVFPKEARLRDVLSFILPLRQKESLLFRILGFLFAPG